MGQRRCDSAIQETLYLGIAYLCKTTNIFPNQVSLIFQIPQVRVLSKASPLIYEKTQILSQNKTQKRIHPFRFLFLVSKSLESLYLIPTEMQQRKTSSKKRITMKNTCYNAHFQGCLCTGVLFDQTTDASRSLAKFGVQNIFDV